MTSGENIPTLPENSPSISEETVSTTTNDQQTPNPEPPQVATPATLEGFEDMLTKFSSYYANLKLNEPEEPVKHKFWDTMPVPKLTEPNPDKEYHGTIDAQKKISDIRQKLHAYANNPIIETFQTPYKLDSQFYWCDCDILDPTQVKEIFELLWENYVEDDGHVFRFKYSIEFLQWALTPPGYHKEWHIGVRVAKNDKLVAFISGIPSTIMVHSTKLKATQIDFLCIHKKLRSKGLTPILIKEITRRVNLKDIWQAVYTAGIFISKPVSTCIYWHRTLNPYKLVKTGFTSIGKFSTIKRMNLFYRVNPEPKIPGIRPMVDSDFEQVHKLTQNFYKNYKLAPVMSPEDVKHWLTPRKNIIYSYVVETESGELTDMISFFVIESDCIMGDKNETIRGAYSYINIANTVSLSDLMSDGLHYAKMHDLDVFNVLDLAQNPTILEDLKFGRGDGKLQYYLFNWNCPLIESKDVALVLL